MDAVKALVHQVQSGDFLLLAAALLLLVAAVSGAIAARQRSHLATRLWSMSGQFGILLALEQAYEFTRGRIPQNSDVALLNAYRVLDLEWRHGLFIESRLEHFFLRFGTFMTAVDVFYALSHVLVTVAALVSLYLWRRDQYIFLRNLLMLTTAIALVAFYLYPTAPPRLLPNYGFVDPMQIHRLVAAGGAQPGSYTYNPYAAMPSLHVGYAVAVAWGLARATRSLWMKVGAALYPLAMAFTVLASANHWLLDIAGALVTVAVAGGALLAGGRALAWTSSLLPQPSRVLPERSFNL